MTVMVETVTPPEHGIFEIDIRLIADIRVTSDSARRQVSQFVGNEIADLLHGETPDLVLCEKGVYLNDPALANAAQFTSWDSFLAAWAEFDEMAAIIRPV